REQAGADLERVPERKLRVAPEVPGRQRGRFRHAAKRSHGKAHSRWRKPDNAGCRCRRYFPPAMNAGLSSGILRTLARADDAFLSRTLRANLRGRRLALCFHRVGPARDKTWM